MLTGPAERLVWESSLCSALKCKRGGKEGEICESLFQ